MVRAMHADPLVRLRTLCLGLPEVTETEEGRPAFRVGRKTFAMYMDNHHGDGRVAVWCKAAPGVQEALVAEGGCFSRPAYLGSRGWVAVDLAPDGGADWDRVEQLVEQAWRMSATQRLRAQRPVPG